MNHRTLLATAAALALLLSNSTAHAGWKSFTKSVSSTANSATNTVASTVTNTATTAVNTSVNGVSSFTAATVASAGSIVLNPKTGMWTVDQYNWSVGQARGMYNPYVAQVNNGYNQSVAAVNSFGQLILEGLFREAGRLAIAKDLGKLQTIQGRAQNLSVNGKQALARVHDAIINRRLDEQGRSDMLTIANELGLWAGSASQTFPSNMQRSSFGVFVEVSAAYFGGVSESYGMVMQTFLEDGKYKVGLIASVGGSAGASIGAGGAVGLFWAPGSIDESTGASVGFGVEAALGPGAGAGLSWSVSAGMTGAQNAIPGFSMAFVSGAKLSAAFNGGWTQLIGKI